LHVKIVINVQSRHGHLVPPPPDPIGLNTRQQNADWTKTTSWIYMRYKIYVTTIARHFGWQNKPSPG